MSSVKRLPPSWRTCWNAGLIEGYHRDGDHFRVEFVAGPEAEEFAQEMWHLMGACKVKGLSCRGIDLSGD